MGIKTEGEADSFPKDEQRHILFLTETVKTIRLRGIRYTQAWLVWTMKAYGGAV